MLLQYALQTDLKNIIKCKNKICENISEKSYYIPSSDEEIDQMLQSQHKGAFVLCIKKSGSIIAFLTCTQQTVFPDNEYEIADDIFIIQDCCVIEQYRGRKYQFKLFRTILKVLKKLDCRCYCCVNPKNIYSLRNILKSKMIYIGQKLMYGNHIRLIFKSK